MKVKRLFVLLRGIIRRYLAIPRLAHLSYPILLFWRVLGKYWANQSRLKKALILLLVLGISAYGTPYVARFWVNHSAKGRVYRNVEDVPECRVAVVLGAQVYRNGALCPMLRDRVDAGIELYKAGKVEKLLMSGDNSVITYDEPTSMMQYAVQQGVPQEDISMDFAGRRTYDSIYRAKHIFRQDRFIVVSQGFHVRRAIFLSKHLGAEVYGFAIDVEENRSPAVEQRELLACTSAMLDVYLLHPKPILGKRETI